MRFLLVLLPLLLLSGCMSLNTKPEDRSFYLLDTKNRLLCLGKTVDCRDMSRIVSARTMLGPIEQAYNKKIKGPNYPVSLVRILLNPSDNSYKAQPVGDSGRYFSLPINEKTRIAWDTLTEIEDAHVSIGGS